MTKRLFPADGVVWMVSMPSGIAAETAWPDADWVEALASSGVEPDDLWDRGRQLRMTSWMRQRSAHPGIFGHRHDRQQPFIDTDSRIGP